MDANSPVVIGVVAAYKRPELLGNLLASLRQEGTLRRVIVVDNGMDPRIEAVCREAPVPVAYQRPERNLGCGGGVERGLSLGLQEEDVTHFCVFDDDAEAQSGALDALVRGMVEVSADVGVPLVLNHENFITWIPGIPDRRIHSIIKQRGLTPEAYRQVCGTAPVPITWAPWPMMAITARVVRECGYPRDDFWLCAEDLEYSLRLTFRHKGVMVPGAVCRHLPPASSGGDQVGGPHYLRSCLLLQNLWYITTRLPHARRVLRFMPHNHYRFIRNFGLGAASFRDAFLSWWRGAVLGKPAGHAGADGFKERFIARYASQSQTI